MLRFNKQRALTGNNVTIWKTLFRIEVSSRSPQSRGVCVLFREDSGADYTILHIDHAPGMGLAASDIRAQGEKISLITASNDTLPVYVYPVRARLNDDFGGWVEWDAEFAFHEGRPGQSTAGQVGFLQFFDTLHKGNQVFLEPRVQKSSSIGGYFDYSEEHSRLSLATALTLVGITASANESTTPHVDFGGRQIEKDSKSGRHNEALADTPEWTDEKNRRRCELVDRDIKTPGPLPQDEQDELDCLQDEMLAYRRKIAPLPLDALRQFHDQLLQVRDQPNEENA